MAIPPTRSDRKLVTYLTEPEAAALLAAPDTATRTGRRDHALLTLAIQAGLRVSELTAPIWADTSPRYLSATDLHRQGLGKQRITPLTPATVKVLGGWAGEHPGKPEDPLFPSQSGSPMSRDEVERRLTKHTTTAARTQPSLKGKKVSPHVLRHTAAMRLLAAGVDTTVIALWLGHESVATTQIYIHADLAIKEKHSPEQPRSTSGPDATSLRTPSWNSSSPCDYAAASGQPPRPIRHRTAASA